MISINVISESNGSSAWLLFHFLISLHLLLPIGLASPWKVANLSDNPGNYSRSMPPETDWIQYSMTIFEHTERISTRVARPSKRMEPIMIMMFATAVSAQLGDNATEYRRAPGHVLLVLYIIAVTAASSNDHVGPQRTPCARGADPCCSESDAPELFPSQLSRNPQHKRQFHGQQGMAGL